MTTAPKPTLCWVLPGISHYHHARIQAFAGRHAGRTVVLNVSDTCGFPEFGFGGKTGGLAYQLETLFHGTYFRNISHRKLRAAIRNGLDAAAVDVVAVQGWSHAYGLLSLEWAIRRGVPRVVTSESQRIDYARAGWKEAVKRRLVRQFQAGLVGGMAHAEYLVELGMPPDRIFLGYDAVDNDHFRTGADAARAGPRPAGLPDRYFVASCRFVARKGLMTLLDAYATYRSRAGPSPWALVILGDGVQRGDLERRRDELGLADSVRMPGFKSYAELPAYYGLAGALVLPSESEQWGLVVNEAMAAGAPVVASNRCGCAAELIHDGWNGFTFPPGDVARLADLLVRVAGECDVREMGRRARERVDAWSPERFASGLSSAVDTAMRQPIPRRRLTDRLLIRTLVAMQEAHLPNEV